MNYFIFEITCFYIGEYDVMFHTNNQENKDVTIISNYHKTYPIKKK